MATRRSYARASSSSASRQASGRSPITRWPQSATTRSARAAAARTRRRRRAAAAGRALPRARRRTARLLEVAARVVGEHRAAGGARVDVLQRALEEPERRTGRERRGVGDEPRLEERPPVPRRARVAVAKRRHPAARPHQAGEQDAAERPASSWRSPPALRAAARARGRGDGERAAARRARPGSARRRARAGVLVLDQRRRRRRRNRSSPRRAAAHRSRRGRADPERARGSGSSARRHISTQFAAAPPSPCTRTSGLPRAAGEVAKLAPHDVRASLLQPEDPRCSVIRASILQRHEGLRGAGPLIPANNNERAMEQARLSASRLAPAGFFVAAKRRNERWRTT